MSTRAERRPFFRLNLSDLAAAVLTTGFAQVLLCYLFKSMQFDNALVFKVTSIVAVTSMLALWFDNLWKTYGIYARYTSLLMVEAVVLLIIFINLNSYRTCDIEENENNAARTLIDIARAKRQCREPGILRSFGHSLKSLSDNKLISKRVADAEYGAPNCTPYYGYYFQLVTSYGRSLRIVAWPAVYGEGGNRTFVADEYLRLYDFGPATSDKVNEIIQELSKATYKLPASSESFSMPCLMVGYVTFRLKKGKVISNP